ncbi:MAG: DUF4331 family protein [Thalassotalea sp.]
MINFRHQLKKIASTSALVLTLGIAATTSIAYASHHFESSLAQTYPQYDLTDMYVFDADTQGYTAFMMDVNPTTGRDGKAMFGENGVYSFHIANSSDVNGEGLTITAHLEGGKLVFGLANGANPAVGAKGTKVGSTALGKSQKFSNGMRVWAGAARDPFVGNSAGLIAFSQKLAKGELDLTTYNAGVDLFAGFNTSAIVVEVPNTMLPKQINVYASSAMYNVDKWEQVNRLANPLVTHLFMADNKMEVSEHVGHRPDMDQTRRYAISSRVLRAASLDGKISDPVKYADSVAAKLLPDMIPYSVGTKASYTFKKINGRAPTDDAMDTVLSLFIGREVTDHANTFDRHPVKFPYLVPIQSK